MTKTHFSGFGLARLRKEFLDTLGNAGHCCLLCSLVWVDGLEWKVS